MVLSPSKVTSTKPSAKDERSTNTVSSGSIKLQRGPKPLKGNRVFLDIKNHVAAGKIEASIKSFGGVVDPFIGKEVNLVVTDRPEWGGSTYVGPGGSPQYPSSVPKPSPSPSPSPLPFLFSPAASPAGNSRGSNASPSTLDSPGESGTGGGRRYSKSRAEAMLEKVRLQPQLRTRDPLTDAQTWGIPIWPIQKILKLFQRLSHDLSKGSHGQASTAKRKANSRTQKIKCRSGQHFIKIESIDRKNKPSYKDLPCWPTINLESEPGTSPFNLKPVSSKGSAAPQQAPSVPPKRKSPRKRASPVKKVSPSKVKKSNLAAQSPKKLKLVALLDRDSASTNYVPRPPSKRHPTRSPFVDSKKEALVKPVYEPLTGYCEICKIDYPDLRAHVETDTHRVYSSNEANYASLDKLINSKTVCIDAFLSLIGANGENTCGSSSACESRVAAPHTQHIQEHLVSVVNTGGSDVNMRQPVDDRHMQSKMVGRKEALEVQCNGISSHVQTRFACGKGDRENLGGIFLGDRINAAQLRKRRAISVSCKDLLELSPSTGERTHYLRSGRAARSELSQLSPALSDNSHPLLNSNSQQSLLSTALSDKSHHLRTRSQLWLSTNLIEEATAKVTNGKATGSLLVTANNNSDKLTKPEKSETFGKVDRSDKTDKSEKLLQSEPSIKGEREDVGEERTSEKGDSGEEDIIAQNTVTVDREEGAEILDTHEGFQKSDKADLFLKNTKIEVERSEKIEKSEVPETSGEGTGKELKDLADHRELRPTRNHSKNKSVRRKRLSAEEKLIEDNRGYYKVEVLNSKLRSTGYFVNHSQGLELSNGRITPDCQEGESKSNGDMKEPVVVRFKKVRRSELSVLSDEAENFMFGEQARSETNSEESSEYEEEEEDDDDEYGEEEEDEDGADDNCSEENSGSSRGSRLSQKNGRLGSGGHFSGKERPRRIRIKVGGDNTYAEGACGDDISLGGSSHGSNSEANGHRKYRKRRTQAEAFITDNMDYYKFEMAGSRLRLHGFPAPVPDGSDSVRQEKEKSGRVEDSCDTEWEDKGSSKVYSCPIDKLHFSFETVPRSEVWYQTFQRQDRGEEIYFPSVSDSNSILLPYQISKGEMVGNQRSALGKRKRKVPARLPRKSPRCHASTLAILSSLVRRRSRDPEKTPIPDEQSCTRPAVETEAKPSPSKKVSSSEGLSSDQQTAVNSSDSRPEYEEDIQEIARNIDSMLGLVHSSNEGDKDQEVVEPKVCGKGRGKKNRGTKTVSVNSGNSVVPSSDRDKDPSLFYLVDPAVLEELSCTCDVVPNPQGGPSMDIVSLLDSYSNCSCVAEGSSNEHGADASCNSSECGASTCDMDRRMRKKRKRRNMTGWDKPKRKTCSRRELLGNQVIEDAEMSQEKIECESSGTAESLQVSSEVDRESRMPKVASDLSSPTLVVRKVGSKRKLRSSSSLSESSPKKAVGCRGRGRGGYQKVMRLMDKEGEATVLQTGLNNRRGTFRKVRRIGWRKIR